jgi:hypothetical protein
MAAIIYKQVPVIQLAPDAIVFINGSETVTDDNGNKYEIRNDISDLSSELNTESVPGSASFTISMPDHSIRRLNETRYDSLIVMSEIEIYMKGRFPVENDDGTLVYPYYHTFWGMITSVIENYSDGIHTIQVSCVDILRWWELTNFITSTAVVGAEQSGEILDDNHIRAQESFMNGEISGDLNTEAIELLPYDFFSNQNIPYILIRLSQISTRDFMPVYDALTPKVGSKISKPDQIEQTDVTNLERDIILYWYKRFGQIGRSLRIFSLDLQTTNATGFNLSGLKDVIGFAYDNTAPDLYKSVMKTKLEIANEVKNKVNFEFFMDTTGEIIFKPPFYNMDVRSCKTNVIEDVDIISWGFNQNDAEIKTRMDVTGEFIQSQTSQNAQLVIKGVALAFDLIGKYGIRVEERTVAWINTPENALIYAQSELSRINALAREGSVVILGRPELRLGYPIYIPSRDAFYYIRGISHDFTFGGSFTTSLSLVSERRKLKDSQGNIISDGFYRSIGQLTDSTANVVGTSIAEPIENDNFVKQLYNQCNFNVLPTVTKPDYVNQCKNVSAMEQGPYELKSGTKLKQGSFNPLKEYQVTDTEGYEIIGAITSSEKPYGLGLQIGPTAVVEDTSNLSKTEIKLKAAQNLLSLQINPKNMNAIILDNTETSMLQQDAKYNINDIASALQNVGQQ